MHTNIEKGDYLISENGEIAYVKQVFPDKLKVLINGKKKVILNTDLYHWSLDNPIKDNRLVSDRTFAIRFRHFLEYIPQGIIISDPCIYEEYDYMTYVANRLFKYQKATVSDKDELDYLNRL